MAADSSTPADGRQTWYDRVVAQVPHSAWRAAGALWFVGLLALRLSTRGSFSSSPLFWLETAVPATILAAYLTRPPPVRPARGFAGVVLPFVAAGLPFTFLVPPFTAFGRAHLDLFMLLLLGPSALMVAGYVALNRSYALMAEARTLVTRGPYALVRHPVYLAQALCGAVVVLFRFSPVTLVLYLAFLAIQRGRIGAEEAALAQAYPDAWAAYCARVPRFVPFLLRSPALRGTIGSSRTPPGE